MKIASDLKTHGKKKGRKKPGKSFQSQEKKNPQQ